MVAATPEPMHHRLVSEADIAAYVSHCHKLAAFAAAGDPPPPSFRLWFHNRYQALPLDELVSDRSAWLYCRNAGLGGPELLAAAVAPGPDAGAGELRQRAGHRPVNRHG